MPLAPTATATDIELITRAQSDGHVAGQSAAAIDTGSTNQSLA